MTPRTRSSRPAGQPAQLPPSVYAAEPAMRRAINATLRRSKTGRDLQGQDADDIVQTIYAKVLAGRVRLPTETEKVAGYLATAARNETIDRRRRQGFEVPAAELPSETQAVDQTGNGFSRTRRPTRRRTTNPD